MAIYRPPKPRWLAVVGGVLVGALVGGGVGYALGSPNEPDLDAAVAALRGSLVRAAGSLEVAAIEYAEAVEDGEIVAEAEHEGSLDAVASSRAEYEHVADALAALAPERAEAIGAAYDELRSAMERRDDDTEIERIAEDLERLLKE